MTWHMSNVALSQTDCFPACGNMFVTSLGASNALDHLSLQSVHVCMPHVYACH